MKLLREFLLKLDANRPFIGNSFRFIQHDISTRKSRYQSGCYQKINRHLFIEWYQRLFTGNRIWLWTFRSNVIITTEQHIKYIGWNVTTNIQYNLKKRFHRYNVQVPEQKTSRISHNKSLFPNANKSSFVFVHTFSIENVVFTCTEMATDSSVYHIKTCVPQRRRCWWWANSN